jgi:hypothetical protein
VATSIVLISEVPWPPAFQSFVSTFNVVNIVSLNLAPFAR